MFERPTYGVYDVEKAAVNKQALVEMKTPCSQTWFTGNRG
jgi:hypothetical protein